MNTDLATFAGGCFWCTEAVFKRLKGVTSVTPGYAGGKRANPTYDQIHSEATGHAEAIQVIFDPKIISYETLLDVFWATHDPTSFDRQGYDAGSEYRSRIFYHNEKQKASALGSKEKLTANESYTKPIVTEIIPYTTFYPAEDEHRDYYDTNRAAPYCTIIIDPKIKKLLQHFSSEIKDEYK